MLPADTPSSVHRLLRRALDKNAQKRLRDIGDAALDLEEALAHLASGAREPAAGDAATRRRVWPSVAAGLAAAMSGAALAAGVFMSMGTGWLTEEAPVFDRFVKIVSTPAHEFAPTVSPDGKWIAYLSNARGPTDVWVKFIAGGDPANLTAKTALSVQSRTMSAEWTSPPTGRSSPLLRNRPARRWRHGLSPRPSAACRAA